MSERRTPPQSLKRRALVGVTGIVALLASGCSQSGSAPEAAPKVPTTTAQSETDAAYEQVYGAVKELREKIAAGKPFSLGVGVAQCVAWKSRAGITVVHNPGMYRYQPGPDELEFLPFVPPNVADGPVMNGPFESYKNGQPYLGTMQEAVPTHGKLLLVPEVATYATARGATMAEPQAAWLEGANGLHVAETALIPADQLGKVFDGDCASIDATSLGS